MSGGSYNYTYAKVEEEYLGNMFDDEMNELIEDLVPILYKLEWWQSCDISEEEYRKEVNKFKEKWKKMNKEEKTAISKAEYDELEPILEEYFEKKHNKEKWRDDR